MVDRTDSLVLAVTSSTAVMGVAVAEGATVLASAQVSTDRQHAEALTPMMADLMTEAGRSISDLDLLAVDVGPGRFTGLRVGLASVRSLAFALDVPVVGMTSLELLALDRAGPVCAVIDARRSEVFQQRFRDGVALDRPQVGSAAELATQISPGELVIGDGADRYAEAYQQFSHLTDQAPSAVELALAAPGRPPSHGHDVVPVYLRDADVQINIKTRHNT